MINDSLLSGPDELAQTVINYRQRMKKVFDLIGGPILLDEQIQALIRLVYHTSLLPDEGRYPRFRVVFASHAFGHGIKFSESWLGQRLDSPDSLRRLAPVVMERGSALLVGPGFDKGLAAWHIVDFERFCAGPTVTSNQLADIPILPNGVLFVRADGPGDLRVMLHPSPIFHLRGGMIRTLDSFYTAVGPFKALIVDLCRELHNALKGDKRIDYFVPNPEVFADDFADLWGASLSVAIERRHGGAFAVVPSSDSPHIKVKYKAEGGLFGAFEETLRHCLDSTDPSGPRYLAIFKQFWQSQQDHLRRVARMIGQLASTDGCVVLDRRLNVKGFGAKIDWSNDGTGARFLPLFDVRTEEEVPEEHIEQRMGTRHRSACRLAQILPDSIMFVVSQDGDLTAIHSDHSKAYRVTQLDAWSCVSELV